MILKAATVKDIKQLKVLDNEHFYGCENEFKPKRKWWVVKDEEEIVAYCGAIYTDNICIFNRAWVHPDYRGLGLQSKMIKVRLKEAKRQNYYKAITYTLTTNVYSANNLIVNGFKLYKPQFSWAGKEQLYFFKDLLPL